MTIRIIRTASLGLPVGTFRTLPAVTEAALVADKEAVYDTLPASSAEPVRAVTGTGIASADLTTAVGVPGSIYTLSDGPNAGAKLTWAIPFGSSTYTWCWWLWPQAAYQA